MKDLITIPEIAKSVNKSDPAVRKIIKENKLKAFNVRSNTLRPKAAYKIRQAAKVFEVSVDHMRDFVEKDRRYLGRPEELMLVGEKKKTPSKK